MAHVFLPFSILLLTFAVLLSFGTTQMKITHSRSLQFFQYFPENTSTFESSSSIFRTKRIHYGAFAHRGEFSSMGAVIIGSKRTCGASLITKIHVLTAAHCFCNEKCSQMTELNPYSTLVAFNTIYLPDTYLKIKCEVKHPRLNETMIYGVTNIKIHEEYDGRAGFNDIAILTLDVYFIIPCGERTDLRPTRLIFDQCIPEATRLYMPGFGRTETGVSLHLKKMEMVKGHNDICRNNNFTPLTNTCAIRGNGEAAKGDSGSPVFIKDPQNKRNLIQMGLMSGTLNDTTASSQPSILKKHVIVNINFYRDWIIRWTEERNMPSACAW